MKKVKPTVARNEAKEILSFWETYYASQGNLVKALEYRKQLEAYQPPKKRRQLQYIPSPEFFPIYEDPQNRSGLLGFGKPLKPLGDPDEAGYQKWLVEFPGQGNSEVLILTGTLQFQETIEPRNRRSRPRVSRTPEEKREKRQVRKAIQREGLQNIINQWSKKGTSPFTSENIIRAGYLQLEGQNGIQPDFDEALRIAKETLNVKAPTSMKAIKLAKRAFNQEFKK